MHYKTHILLQNCYITTKRHTFVTELTPPEMYADDSHKEPRRREIRQ